MVVKKLLRVFTVRRGAALACNLSEQNDLRTAAQAYLGAEVGSPSSPAEDFSFIQRYTTGHERVARSRLREVFPDISPYEL